LAKVNVLKQYEHISPTFFRSFFVHTFNEHLFELEVNDFWRKKIEDCSKNVGELDFLSKRDHFLKPAWKKT
jgi:hypothetical protein